MRMYSIHFVSVVNSNAIFSHIVRQHDLLCTIIPHIFCKGYILHDIFLQRETVGMSYAGNATEKLLHVYPM